LVSIERALEDYGVALKKRDEKIVVDVEQTLKQRSRKTNG
jgi:hypothetical protein